jgi:hypothetical protein
MKKAKGENFFVRHKFALSILIFAFGLILILSIVSYSPKDEANLLSLSEIGKIFTGDELVRIKLERTKNWLGFFGAKLSFLFFKLSFRLQFYFHWFDTCNFRCDFIFEQIIKKHFEIFVLSVGVFLLAFNFSWKFKVDIRDGGI